MVLYKRVFLDWLMRFRARSKADLIFPMLSRHDHVLDLGAAEGFVAERLLKRIGIETQLVDVVDMNRTEQPHCIYDGRKLPFTTDSFDVVLVVYVLHHTDNVPELLLEATRVASRCVIVLESTYRKPWERRVLTKIDRFLNQLRSERMMDEGPLDFRPIEEWLKLFESLRINVIARRDLGGFIHHRALFVLDASKSP